MLYFPSGSHDIFIGTYPNLYNVKQTNLIYNLLFSFKTDLAFFPPSMFLPSSPSRPFLSLHPFLPFNPFLAFISSQSFYPFPSRTPLFLLIFSFFSPFLFYSAPLPFLSLPFPACLNLSPSFCFSFLSLQLLSIHPFCFSLPSHPPSTLLMLLFSISSSHSHITRSSSHHHSTPSTHTFLSS